RTGQLPPGQPFEGEVTLAAAAFSGRIELEVVDAAGASVERLPSLQTGLIDGSAPWVRGWRWSPGTDALAGDYRLQARLLDAQGRLQAERSLPLLLEARLDLGLVLQPATAELPQGQSLAIAFGLDFPSGNAVIDGGQLRLWIERADGGSELLWS